MIGPRTVRRSLRAAIVLTCISAASLFWLLALTQAGQAVQGAPHARATAALLATLGAVALWAGVWSAANRNPFGRWRPRGEHPNRAPRRLIAARIALAVASVITLLMIASLPYPPTSRDDRIALAALATVAVAGIGAAILITRRSPVGRWLTVALGAYGLGMALWRLPSMLPPIGPDAGAGPVVLLLIVGSVWSAHMFAAVCVLSLRGAWPPASGAAGAAGV